MHANYVALLDLHNVNTQRQRLLSGRTGRNDQLAKLKAQAAKVFAFADKAQADVEQTDALLRQYTDDVTRCDETIAKLREQQMAAKTNKEYMASINGVEEAKAEKKIRLESLNNLNAQIDELRAKAEAAEEQRTTAQLKVEELEQENANAGNGNADDSENELERIYQEKKQTVDPKFLEHYERLIKAKHKFPLMKVDPNTRTTPMGNMLTHNQLEFIRQGQLVVDTSNNAILYIDE